MIFQIKIDEKIIEIHSIYREIFYDCRDYLVDGLKADIVVEMSPEDIAFERQVASADPSACDYPDCYYEKTAVYRKLCTDLLAHRFLLIHGSVVAVDNHAFLFSALSGTGKTTHTDLWLKNITGSYILNGDKPLIQVSDKIYAHGTPWCGKERLQTNAKAELNAIVLLERGKENEIQKISAGEAFAFLLQQTLRSKDKGIMVKTVELLRDVLQRTPLYRLKCNITDDAALLAYQAIALSGQEL